MQGDFVASLRFPLSLPGGPLQAEKARSYASFNLPPGFRRFAPTSPAACRGLVTFGAFSPLPAGRALASRKARAFALVCLYIGHLESKLSGGLYTNKNRMTFVIRPFLLAVGGGFEPPVQLPVRQFSKLVVSATHPSHQTACLLLNRTAKI